MQRPPTAKLCALIALMLPNAARAGTDLRGLSVEEFINRLSEDGLVVYYSSDLVRRSMQVEAEPEASAPLDLLTEVLSPHGLMLRPGFNGSWLVVRQPASRELELPEVSRATPVIREDSSGTAALPEEQIVVSASRYEIQGAHTTSRHVLGNVDLEFSPDIGEDAMRAVARLPGMASNGLSALANVRGGEVHETLVRLDGLRLYDPFHLRDFQRVFSVIEPRVVESMDVYTGGYPVEYGDRMSGVIDVKTMSPPEDLYHEIGLSFFNSSVLSAGRFVGDRAEWVMSARRSNIDILYDRFSEQPERPRYTDLFAKLAFDVSERLRITGSVLRATDRIALADDVDREERAAARQTDSYGWLEFDHAPGGQMSGTTLLAATDVSSFRSGTSEKAGVSSGWLSDSRSFSVDSLRSEWSRIIGARLLLDFGGEVSRFGARYDYQDQAGFEILFDVEGAPAEPSRNRALTARPHGRQYGLFASLRFDLSTKLTTEFGYRWGEQNVSGVSRVTSEPRIGVRYAVSDDLSLRASAGRFFQVQGIDELQISDGLTEFSPPQKGDHFVVGLDRRLDSGMVLRVEAYEKAMDDLRPRFENLLNTRVLLPELKPDRLRIAPESARARGVELSLDGESGALRWLGSLSLARVEDRFAGIDVLRSWDQAYTLNAAMLWEPGHWSFSSGLVYRSGWPTTHVELDTDALFPVVSVGSRNGERMPTYGSLDVRLSRKIQFNDSVLDVFVELVNLTDRKNTCCIEYEIGDEEDLGLLALDERAWLPTIPSVGFTWTF